jgi:catechol 2,3-dioxygenase-like lactoylglutathione lyase family enzyme
MPKIKHITLSTQDVEKTAKFYVDRRSWDPWGVLE